MAFPYAIKKKLFIHKTANLHITKKRLIQTLYNQLQNSKAKDIEKKGNSIRFSTSASLIRFRYTVEFNITQTNHGFILEYEVFLSDLLVITLIILLIAAFFSRHSFHDYLVFSGIFVVLFYLINVLYIHSSLKTFIKQNSFFRNSIVYRQSAQAHKPSRCPRCSERLEHHHAKCLNCGFELPLGNRSHRANITNYAHKKIVYEYFEPEKTDED